MFSLLLHHFIKSPLASIYLHANVYPSFRKFIAKTVWPITPPDTPVPTSSVAQGEGSQTTSLKPTTVSTRRNLDFSSSCVPKVHDEGSVCVIMCISLTGDLPLCGLVGRECVYVCVLPDRRSASARSGRQGVCVHVYFSLTGDLPLCGLVGRECVYVCVSP